MTISHCEGALRPAQHTPVLSGNDAAFHRIDVGRQEIDDAVLFIRDRLDWVVTERRALEVA